MKQKIKNFLQSGKDGNEPTRTPSKKTGYLIVIGLAGLLLLLLGNVFSSSGSDPEPNQMQLNSEQKEDTGKDAAKDTTAKNMAELETSYENDLTTLLNKIQGVSDAEVMVNLESTNVKIYEKDLVSGNQTTSEEDTNGGTRKVEDRTEDTQVVLVREGDKEVPILTQTKKPEVRGVFVVAKGVDHATVKNWVVESISRVLDVPTHRVSVMPKN